MHQLLLSDASGSHPNILFQVASFPISFICAHNSKLCLSHLCTEQLIHNIYIYICKIYIFARQRNDISCSVHKYERHSICDACFLFWTCSNNPVDSQVGGVCRHYFLGRGRQIVILACKKLFIRLLERFILYCSLSGVL